MWDSRTCSPWNSKDPIIIIPHVLHGGTSASGAGVKRHCDRPAHHHGTPRHRSAFVSAAVWISRLLGLAALFPSSSRLVPCVTRCASSHPLVALRPPNKAGDPPGILRISRATRCTASSGSSVSPSCPPPLPLVAVLAAWMPDECPMARVHVGARTHASRDLALRVVPAGVCRVHRRASPLYLLM